MVLHGTIISLTQELVRYNYRSRAATTCCCRRKRSINHRG